YVRQLDTGCSEDDRVSYAALNASHAIGNRASKGRGGQPARRESAPTDHGHSDGNWGRHRLQAGTGYNPSYAEWPNLRNDHRLSGSSSVLVNYHYVEWATTLQIGPLTDQFLVFDRRG